MKYCSELKIFYVTSLKLSPRKIVHYYAEKKVAWKQGGTMLQY